MVKVAILGAHSLMAGEVLRILINHPETELTTLYSPENKGKNVSSVHHGFYGETQLIFTDKINPEETDLIIAANDSEDIKNLLDSMNPSESLKWITINKDLINEASENVYPALSEYDRKMLVRKGHAAYTLSPLLVAPLIALAPLADYLLLNSDIKIEIKAPEDIIEKEKPEELVKELKEFLKQRQNSFNGDILFEFVSQKNWERGMEAIISFPNSLPLAEIEKIYEEKYDDHNFSFLAYGDSFINDVAGTQKVLISLNKNEPETLVLKTVSDARLRGGAGDIVHTLNLFFGLHEKTGLHLKPSAFFNPKT